MRRMRGWSEVPKVQREEPAGLAAAHELRRLQRDFLLLESRERVGGRLYTETSLGARPVSVPGIALSLVGRIFESVSDCKVLLLGAGETVELTARLLADDGVKQITFTNRSPEKAKALASCFHGWTVPWEERAKAFGAKGGSRTEKRQ